MCAIRDSFLLVWRQNRASLLFHAPDSRARTRSGLAAGGRRPAELRLVLTETCFCQLVAGYLACGRVADDASNAPPGSRSRKFLDAEDQVGDLLLVEGS